MYDTLYHEKGTRLIGICEISMNDSIVLTIEWIERESEKTRANRIFHAEEWEKSEKAWSVVGVNRRYLLIQ